VTGPLPELPARLGDYDVLGEVGRGPTGYVCLVRGPEGRDLAAKVLHPRYADDPERVRRFVSEALVAKTLAHPHIVKVHRVVSQFDFPIPFYVMDHLTGGHIGRFRGQLTPAVLGRLADVCDALAFLHARKLVHFDVKPTNILLAADGTAHLADFGTTTLVASGPPPGGTLAYMAPEHFAADAPDFRADVYSAGVVLYELSTGELPFAASNPFALQYQIQQSDGPPRPARAGLPDAVWAVIRRAMAARPDDRYPTATDMAAALRSAAATITPQ
jgi:serine/threonine-protein kinase